MFDSTVAILDWLGIIAFSFTGALVASRKQMDLVGFVLLGTVTGIGGGTVRDILLGADPIFWVHEPMYVAVCVLVAAVAFFTAYLAQSRYRLILWFDAVGLALFATTGAERALSMSTGPIIAVVMGVITACFGGIIRDTLGRERSIIFSYEIYVTAALAAASVFAVTSALGVERHVSVTAAILFGLALRVGGITFGWSLPRYRPRPGASQTDSAGAPLHPR